MRHTLIALYLFLFLLPSLSAQDQPANTGSAVLFRLGYGLQLPAADMATRFGANFNAEAGLDFLTRETNWFFGLNGQFLFGSEVETDVLAPLRTPEGLIYGNDRSPADIQLRMRGFYLGAQVGKLFRLSPDNPRSALRLSMGAGLLQHKIRIQDDPIRAVPQLTEEYKKGYDRLSNGLAFNQFIGYQLLDREGLLNFYAGLEFTQGFTRNRRSFHFDTRQAEQENRFDLLLGLRIGWILPFYFKRSDEVYY